MSSWIQATPKKLIETIPQLSQENYEDLKGMLLLYSKYQKKCESIVLEERGISFQRLLRWEHPSIYKLYMDLVYDNETFVTSKSVFRYKNPYSAETLLDV